MVDDLQWLDAASFEAILFAARRIEAEPAALLLAMRDDGSGAWSRLGLPVRHVTGLDRAASIELVTGEAGGPVPEEVADRLFTETGGNPLALIEIPRLLPRGLVAGLEALGDEPLPVNERIEWAFARQAAGLGEGARTALLVAAANDAADVDPVLAALGVLGLERRDLEAVETAGLLAIDGTRLEFRHPLVRSSVYQAADPAQRRAVHRALAAALEDGGEASTVRRAWHLALTVVGHDEAVATVLERAATSAGQRGAFVAAAHAWERAGRLSPDPEATARRLYESAEAWHMANHHGRALALLDEAEPLAQDRLLLADMRWLHGRIDGHRGPAVDGAARLRDTAIDLRDIAPDRAIRLLTASMMSSIGGGKLGLALEAAESAHRLAPPVGDPLELIATLQLGKIRVLTGDVAGGYPLVMRAVELLDPGCPLDRDADLVQVAPALLTIEEYDLEARVLDRAVRTQRAANALGLLAYSLAALSELDVRRGRWAAAEANGAEAIQLAREAGQAGQTSYNLGRVARLDAARGRDDQCRDRVARAVDVAARHNYESTVPFAESSLGLLDLGRGRMPEAIRHLAAAGRAFVEMGFRTPGRLEWQADLVEAFVRAGRIDEAEAELATFETTIATCRRPTRRRARGRGMPPRERGRRALPWPPRRSGRGRGLVRGRPRVARPHERAVRAGADGDVPRRAAAACRAEGGGTSAAWRRTRDLRATRRGPVGRSSASGARGHGRAPGGATGTAARGAHRPGAAGGDARRRRRHEPGGRRRPLPHAQDHRVPPGEDLPQAGSPVADGARRVGRPAAAAGEGVGHAGAGVAHPGR